MAFPMARALHLGGPGGNWRLPIAPQLKVSPAKRKQTGHRACPLEAALPISYVNSYVNVNCAASAASSRFMLCLLNNLGRS